MLGVGERGKCLGEGGFLFSDLGCVLMAAVVARCTVFRTLYVLRRLQQVFAGKTAKDRLSWLCERILNLGASTWLL